MNVSHRVYMVGGGKTVNVYDAPRTSRQSNWFEATAGARPGMGKFLVRKTDAVAVMLAGGTSKVVFEGDAYDQSAEITVYVLGYEVYSWESGGGIVVTDDTLVELVVVDDRYRLWLGSPVSKRYNVQDMDKGFDSTTGNAEFLDSSLNSSSEWTWQGVCSDVLSSLSIPGGGPSWKPRNLTFESCPMGQSVQRLADSLFLILGYDFSSGEYTLNDPNVLCLLNETDAIKEAVELNVGPGQGANNNKSLPGLVNWRARKLWVSSPDRNVDRYYLYTKTTGTGNTGIEGNKTLAEYYAHYVDSTIKNGTELSTAMDDLTSRFIKLVKWDAGVFCVPGLYPFHLDGRIRSIRWVCDANGAKTYVKYNDSSPFSPGLAGTVEEYLGRWDSGLVKGHHGGVVSETYQDPRSMKFAKVTAMKLSGGGTATDFPTDSKYLTYVTANPCADDNGGSVDTGTTLYIGFNNSTTMGEAPPNAYITAVNEIIGYMPYTGVKTFAAGAVKLNGWVVPGRGCWPDWVRVR